MSAIEFRQLDETTIESIQPVARAAWEFAYKNIYSGAVITEMIDHYYGREIMLGTLSGVSDGTTWFDVALENDRVVGFCGAIVTPFGVELSRLYLHPDYLGRGIAGKLLERLESFVLAKGEGEYFCFVDRRNELGIRFYMGKKGFVHLRRRDVGDDWFMRRTLPGALARQHRMNRRVRRRVARCVHPRSGFATPVGEDTESISGASAIE